VRGVACCCARPILRCIRFMANITSGCLVGSWCLESFSTVPKLFILRRMVALSACLSGFRGGKGGQDIEAVDSLRVVVYLRG
jgi:hypothetical protein